MTVKNGDKVTLEYEGKLENGEVFDSSEKSGKKLEFVVGEKQVIPGFEKGIIGMEKGEEKEIVIEKEDAYGDYKEELKNEIPKDVLPKDPEPKAGMMLVMTTPEGQQVPAKIAEIKESTVVLDLNHPLAGKKLTFKIKMVEINSK